MTKDKDVTSESTPAQSEGVTEVAKEVVAKSEASPTEETQAENADAIKAVAAAKAAEEEVVRAEEAAKAAEEAVVKAIEAANAAKAKAESAKKSFIQRMNSLRPFTMQDAVKYQKETGMHRDDIREIANTALLNNVILSFREVSKEASEKMDNENAAGKPMNIKAKSASDGPAKVFVPMPQAFGKAGTNVDMSNPASVKHAKELIKKLEDVTNKSLKASADKLRDGPKDKTEKFLHVEKKPLKTKDGEQIYGFVIDKIPNTNRDGSMTENPTNGLPYRTLGDIGELVFAVKRGDDFFDANDGKPLFKTFVAKAVPIEILVLTEYKAVEKEDEPGKYQFVVSNPSKIEQPIVGDYDQFTIGLDIEYTRESGRGETHNRYESSLGIGTEVDFAVSGALMAGTKDHMGVQHGAEIANPYPEPLTGVTFFIPEGGAVKVVICKNEQMILDVYNQYGDRFDLPVNPLWGWTRDDNGKLIVDPERINAMALSIANKHFLEHIHDVEAAFLKKLTESKAIIENAELAQAMSADTLKEAQQSVVDLQSSLEANRHMLKLANNLEIAYRKLGSAKAAPKYADYKQNVDRARKEFTDLAAQVPDSHLMKMVQEAEARSKAVQQPQTPKPNPVKFSVNEPGERVELPAKRQELTRKESFVERLRRASLSTTAKSKSSQQGVEMVSINPESPKVVDSSKQDKASTPRLTPSRPPMFARSLTLPRPTSLTPHADSLNKGGRTPTVPHDPDAPGRY